MINADGWRKYCIWEHSGTVRALYAARCLRQAEEMTCHAQAAELLAPHVAPGDTLLDAGCGSGYFFHSLADRGLDVAYCGIDAAPGLIAIGREHMPGFGLAPQRLLPMRIEDLDGRCDHVVCLNVLTNIDNYHRPLERLLLCAGKTLILRESCAQTASYAYVRDRYLDPGQDLKVHVNTYALDDMLAFIESYGFSARAVLDRRTGGQPELVIGYPHFWTFIVAERNPA